MVAIFSSSFIVLKGTVQQSRQGNPRTLKNTQNGWKQKKKRYDLESCSDAIGQAFYFEIKDINATRLED